MNYKGYEIETSYDYNYPEPNNWMVFVYELSADNESLCVWINDFPSKQEAIEAAKEWINDPCQSKKGQIPMFGNVLKGAYKWVSSLPFNGIETWN